MTEDTFDNYVKLEKFDGELNLNEKINIHNGNINMLDFFNRQLNEDELIQYQDDNVRIVVWDKELLNKIDTEKYDNVLIIKVKKLKYIKKLKVIANYVVVDNSIRANKMKLFNDEYNFIKDYDTNYPWNKILICPLNRYKNYLSNKCLIKFKEEELQDELSFDGKIDLLTKSFAILLKEKNKRYGNAALEPLSIFTDKCKVGQRLDDKLARIKNSDELRKNDVFDLCGYLFLTCVENEWLNAEDLID